jgi:hypothetical protein
MALYGLAALAWGAWPMETLAREEVDTWMV